MSHRHSAARITSATTQRIAAGLLALACLLLQAPLVASAVPVPGERPRPVLLGNFADPTVAKTKRGYVAIATGQGAPRAWARGRHGAWRKVGPALAEYPSWGRAGDIWASDIVRVGRTWLLYMSVPVRGLGKYGRCVGVARSRSAYRNFRPVGTRPLVCPRYADTPPADDQILPRDPTLPRAGVIDPSYFRDPGTGRRYLIYKTDRIPSSIRIVPLTRNGRHVPARARSRELTRSRGVIENPLLIRRPQGYLMITSRGDWTRCSYRTSWTRSTSLLDWRPEARGRLLSQRSAALCGPGGADVAPLLGHPRAQRLYFHGWTCHQRPVACDGKGKWDHKPRAKAVRSMYAARVRFPRGVPVIRGWLRY